MATINTDFIDKINAQLEGITSLLDDYCAQIQKAIDNLSSETSTKLQSIRTKIIAAFKPQVEKIKAKIQPIITLKNILTNLSLDNIVSAVTSIIELLIAPYQPYIDFITQMATKIVTLSNNIQRIVNYAK